jgi:hypothetical protein
MTNFKKCPRCQPLYNTFIDLSVTTDSRLQVLGNLLECIGDKELLDESTLRGAGTEIREYLERKRILEYVFLGRTLTNSVLSDIDLNAELKRIKAHYAEAII